jgi:fatty-acyl-CoA synthase
MTLDQALHEVVSSYPDREALVFETTRVTYRELGQRVNALATGLRHLGLRTGDKVAVILPNCPEFVTCFFGIGQAGGVVVPVNPLYTRREIQHILGDAEAVAAIFISDAWGNDLLGMIQDMRDELPHLRHLIVAEETAPEGAISLDSVMPLDAQPLASQSESDDLFGLMYTSGTTGLPKAVMHTHRTMLVPVLASDGLRRAMFERPTLRTATGLARVLTRYGGRFLRWAGKPQTMLNPSPYHAMAGYGSITTTLLFGYRLVILERFHPVRILELVEREHVNVLSATPTMYSLTLDVRDFDRYDKTSVLYCTMGAAPCPPELVRRVRERFGCPVIISFGATEAGTAGLVTRIEDPDDLQVETVGRAFPGVDAKIVDAQRHEVPPGQVGEVALHTQGVMKGYYGAPEATAEAVDAEGWYYTGDLGVMDEKGYLRIVGRKKDMIIRGGQNVYPAEVERYLLTHPAVQSVAVVGVPTEREGETVWAYVVPKDGRNLTDTAILDYCRGEIAAYKVPSEVRIVDTLPRTPTQKVKKFELRQQALQELERRQPSRS